MLGATELAPHVPQTEEGAGVVATNEPLGVPTLLGTAKLRLCLKLVGGLYTCFAICNVLMLGNVLRRLGGGWTVGVWRRSRNGDIVVDARCSRNGESCSLDELGGERDGTRKAGGLGHLGTAGGLLVDGWVGILLGVVSDDTSSAGVGKKLWNGGSAAPMRPCPRIMPATAAAMACTLSADGAAAVARTLCCGAGLAV